MMARRVLGQSSPSPWSAFTPSGISWSTRRAQVQPTPRRASPPRTRSSIFWVEDGAGVLVRVQLMPRAETIMACLGQVATIDPGTQGRCGDVRMTRRRRASRTHAHREGPRAAPGFRTMNTSGSISRWDSPGFHRIAAKVVQRSKRSLPPPGLCVEVGLCLLDPCLLDPCLLDPCLLDPCLLDPCFGRSE